MKLENIENKKVAELIGEYNTRILKFVEAVNKFLPNDFKLGVDYHFEIYREDHDNYENDGNTQTPGYSWGVHWAFPLSEDKDFYKDSINDGYASESLVFTITNINERISDGRVDGGKFVSIYVYQGKFFLDEKEDRSKRQIKIDHQNDNYADFSILNKMNLARVVKRIRELHATFTLYREIEDNNVEW